MQRLCTVFRVPLALAVALAMLVAGCSSGGTDATIEAATPTTSTAVAGTAATSPTTTTARASSTTTVPSSRAEDWVFADPALVAQVATAYCDVWPAVGPLLAEPVVFVDVPDDGWMVGRDLTRDLPAGVERVTSAIDEMSAVGADCVDASVVNGDWISVPVMMHFEDGSAEEGLWVLQIGPTGSVYWHFSFTSPTGGETAEPVGEIAVAAREFCGLFGGMGERDPEPILGAMVTDPAIHNIINKRHYVGQDEITAMVPQYLAEEAISCGPVTTQADWSANAWALDNDDLNIHLVGLTIQKHAGDRIARQYITVTQLSGATPWGDYTWGADAAGRGDN